MKKFLDTGGICAILCETINGGDYMNLYQCKLNQIAITGDSYGMSPCLVVAEKHFDENCGFDVVTFLDLTTGSCHDSGSKNGNGLDECIIVDSITQQQAEKIKEVWKYKESEQPHIFDNTNKCVHTEHCCAEHGCKYGDKNCPVWLGYVKQSFGHDDGFKTYPIPTIAHSVFVKRRELSD